MILIGIHPAIDTEKTVVFVDAIGAIEHTPAGSLAVLDFDENDLGFYAKAEVPLALRVKDVRAFILAAATSARYVVAPLELARNLQKLTDHYLYDIKVLAETGAQDLEAVAQAGIDGILVRHNPPNERT